VLCYAWWRLCGCLSSQVGMDVGGYCSDSACCAEPCLRYGVDVQWLV
jgi:hypothetical protein